MNDRFQEIAAGLANIGPALERFGKAATPAGRSLLGALWRSYHEAGCPYGESREGLQRWLRGGMQ